MTYQDCTALFHSMHPDFFKQEYLHKLPEDETYEEMLLRLDDFNLNRYHKEFDRTVSFGFYKGELEELQKLVEQVEPSWVNYYHRSDRIYCGYLNGNVVSFCLVENMGTHQLDGRDVRIGGPGCVGTLPQYRNRGIGLTMVNLATAILQKECYDYSYIHYTAIAPWYAKLGYQTCLYWTKDGIVPER